MIISQILVNLSLLVQIINNGKLSSADHRIVTNKMAARTTVTSFIHPSNQCHIEPAKMLVKDGSRPLHKDFIYKDFLGTYIYSRYSPEKSTPGAL